MTQESFETSRNHGGRHYALARLAGTWQGRSRVWLEPDKLADESNIFGTIRVVLGGRFVIHEYRTEFGGESQQGIAIIGYHLDRQRFESAWIDSFHTGTSIMMSAGVDGGASTAVLGHYGDGKGGPDWGWRTTLDHVDEDHLLITAWNITPEGDEAKALEVSYARRREIT